MEKRRFGRGLAVLVVAVSLLLVVSSLYSAEELSKTNIGSFTATNTPLYIQVCKDGTHKGEFSIIKGSKTLYYGKASGKTKDNLYFYVPIELKVTYTDREIWAIRMQDRYIEPSPYCFAVSKEERGSLLSREMTDRSVAAETGLKPGKDLKFSITGGFQTYLINRTISKRFKDLLRGQPGCSNYAKVYFLIAPREDFDVDKIKKKEITTTLNIVLYTYHPATRLKARVKPTNKANDLVIKIKTKFVNEKTFLKNLPEPQYIDTAYYRPDFERAKTAWVKEFGREGRDNYMYAGSYHVYLKNPTKEPLVITKVTLNNKDIGKIYLDVDKIPPQEHPPLSYPKELPQKYILWFRVLPNPVPTGGLSEIIIRPRVKPEGKEARITLFTDKGTKIPVTIKYTKPKMILSSISFSKDLKKVYLYLRKMTKEKMKIGRVFLNGKDVTSNSFIPEKEFIKAREVKYPIYSPAPSIYNDLSPITIHLKEALINGSPCIIKVEDTKGKATAYMVRAFPQEFPLQISWANDYKKVKDSFFDTNVGFPGPKGKEGYDKLQKAGLKGMVGGYTGYKDKKGRKYEINYGPERTIPILESTKGHPALWGHMIMDEPNGQDFKFDATIGNNLGYFASGCNRIYLFCMKHSPGKPIGLFVANGYNPMGSCVYGEISDFCYHHGYYSQLLPSILNVLETKEAAQPRPVYHIPYLGMWKKGENQRKWLTPDALRIWCYGTLSIGCKGFVYYPAHGGILRPSTDKETRERIWREVVRLNAEVRMLEDYIATGEVIHLAKTNDDFVEANTILSTDKGIILMLLNKRWHATAEGQKVWPSKEVEVTVNIPSFLKVKDVFTIDWKNGPKKIEYQLLEKKIKLNFKEIYLNKTVVLSTEKDGFEKIRGKYLEALKPKL